MQKKRKDIKVLHLGDMAFVGYSLVELLRKNNISADYLYYRSPEIPSNKEWLHSFKTSQSDRFNKLKIMRESNSFCRNYDVIHAHSIFGLPLLFTKKPYILHLHGTDLRVYSKGYTPLALGLRRLIKNANKIIVSTPDLLDEVSYLRKNATFLPNPINFNIFKPFQSKRDLHDGTEFVLFHPASQSPTKRNDILINSFSEVVRQGYDARLLLVEWGSLINESKKLIEKLDLRKNIEWIKHINRADLPDYYNASDIVCDQFLLNGLGLVTLEAMACGKPVVTKNIPHTFKTAYSTALPLSPIDNEISTTNEIIRLLESSDLRKKVGLKCSQWVAKEHSDSKILSLLSESYEQLKSEN